MSVVNATPLLLGDEGYQISRSVRLRSSASAYFNRTPAGAGNQQKWTWSGWVKRGSFGQQQLFTAGAGTGGSPECYIDFEDNLNFQIFDGTSNLAVVRSTAVYRDPSAWYHVVVAIDTTQATAANRVLLYINGQAITSFAFSTYPTQNLNTQVNAVTAHRISSSTRISAYYLDGYLTEVNFIDGQALTPSSFGETDSITGVWKAKKYAGTYGTNGFYLNFSDPSAATAAAIGKDYSGNGNNWTPNNISVTSGVTYDSMLDVPTMWADGGNGRGNYATLNPLYIYNANGTLSGANLDFTGGNNAWVRQATIPISVKNYCEVTVNTKGTNDAQECGLTTIGNQDFIIEWVWSISGNRLYVNGAASGITMPQVVAGDIIGMAVDPVAKSFSFYRNNTLAATVTYAATTEVTFYVGNTFTNGSWSGSINFGQRPFTYTPPTGFKALNTQNLPDATIKKGNAYFDASLWSGDNSSPRAITNSGSMQPDLVWVKRRNGAADHTLFDAVRGFGSNKELSSNTTGAEGALNTSLYGNVSAANSTGFQLTAGSTDSSYTNRTGDTYVGWQWKESASAGFDIVTYTGTGANRTVAHSLGVAPAMMIVKTRSVGTYDWCVYHSGLTSASYYLGLNATAAQTLSTNVWNATAPTSSVFSVGTSVATNQSGQTLVAYLFAEVAGYSKFGSYTGNGSADGPFVYLGFRPRFILTKNITTAQAWQIYDTSRETANAMSTTLFPTSSSTELTNTAYLLDVTANGFKIRNSGADNNQSSSTIIYAAFAENPFKNSLAR